MSPPRASCRLANLVDFHPIKHGVVEVRDLLGRVIERKRPCKLLFGQTRFGGLPSGQGDFDHVTALRLAAKTAGPQVGNQDEQNGHVVTNSQEQVYSQGLTLTEI